MRSGEGGYTYLGVLFLVGLIGLALAGTGEVWSQAALRARESELLWVGNQYARALRSYYQRSPRAPHYPRSLDELLEDRRQGALQRHLRKLYADPLSGRADWELVKLADGSIVGVRSRSEAAPLKRENFPPRWQDFRRARRHADWWFVAEPAFAPLLSEPRPAAGTAPGDG